MAPQVDFICYNAKIFEYKSYFSLVGYKIRAFFAPTLNYKTKSSIINYGCIIVVSMNDWSTDVLSVMCGPVDTVAM